VISVIICTYNRANLLPRAILSVQKQTLQPLEIIVIDDGSTDNTIQVLKNFKKIRVISKKNSGISSARNLGIKLSCGKYIAFLDDDDEWHEDKLKLQMSLHEANNISFSHTNEIWIHNNKEIKQKKHHKKPDGWSFYENIDFCKISPSTVMIKKSIFDEIGLFDEELEVCEDFDMWLRILKFYPIKLLEKTLTTKYAGESSQLSFKYFAMDRFRIIALAKHIEDKQVRAMIDKKVTILKKGAIKHQNRELIEFLKAF